MFWRDRAEAGRALGARLASLSSERPVLLGLTRGGVPVAAEAARALGAPLDALVVRKVGAPGQPEYALGAVGEEGASWRDLAAMRAVGVDEAWFERAARSERAEVERRLAALRAEVPALPLAGRLVIVVDDGVATGSTAEAALRVVRARGASRALFAAPVGSREAARLLAGAADRVVILETPADFRAVGQWYEDFGEVSDAEMLALLRAARAWQNRSEKR